MSVNKVILVGNLGQNPEVRYTPSGAAVANFSLATNESWVDKSGQKQDKTEWHKIVVWGKTAEHCQQYLSKGRQIYVEGRLQTRQWQDKEGQTRYTTEVQAQLVQFLGGKLGDSERASQSPEPVGESHFAASSSSSFSSPAQPVSPSPQFASSVGTSFTEDDIPF